MQLQSEDPLLAWITAVCRGFIGTKGSGNFAIQILFEFILSGSVNNEKVSVYFKEETIVFYISFQNVLKNWA